MNKTSRAIVILLLPALALAQNSVSGTVTDKDSGQPLVGVNVVVEGTAMGSATGADGSYTISDVSDGSYTVTATYIGYSDQSKSVSVNGSSTTANFHSQYLLWDCPKWMLFRRDQMNGHQLPLLL